MSWPDNPAQALYEIVHEENQITNEWRTYLRKNGRFVIEVYDQTSFLGKLPSDTASSFVNAYRRRSMRKARRFLERYVEEAKQRDAASRAWTVEWQEKK